MAVVFKLPVPVITVRITSRKANKTKASHITITTLQRDRDNVLNAKNELKKSEKYKNAYIKQGYARAVQMETERP